MRLRIPVMTGVVLLAALVSVGGGWAMTFEDLQKEIAAKPADMGSTWDIRVPIIMSGTSAMLLTDVCVSGDTVRPKDPSKANMDMGKVRPGNQYSVVVQEKISSATGDHLFAYERTVELPPCK